MSQYQFIASEKPLFEEFSDARMIYDPSQKVLAKSSYSQDSYLRIIEDSDIIPARAYTNKPYIYLLDWSYTEENAAILIDIIQTYMKNEYKLLCYNVWEGDKTPVEARKLPIEDINIDVIRNLWDKDLFDVNECLCIFRWDSL